MKIKGLRLDPGYLYDSIFVNKGIVNAPSAARVVVADAVAMGIDTIFVSAYNPVYGAYYPTTWSKTIVEGGFGKGDLLKYLLEAATAVGIKVVAWLPVNTFKHAWTAFPDWRSKKKDGTDYKPDANVFLLSAWHDGFQAWYKGFLEDLIGRYPSLYALEAGEGMVDFFWNRAADYNPIAKKKFAVAYPNAALGDASWRKHRAEGLTKLHAILSEVAHTAGKKSMVVQTWSAKNDVGGSLMTSSEIMNGCGFDFDGILNLTGTAKPDFIIGEFMWQQWRAEYNNPIFTPAWTGIAVREFVGRVKGRGEAVGHIELSPFGSVTPTTEQFVETLSHAWLATGGLDFYDYNLVFKQSAFEAIKRTLPALV